MIAIKWCKIVPSLFACLMVFENLIFFVGSDTAGTAWTEYSHLFYECDNYWWTPLLFLNDLVPFFAKDMYGCMRWTCIFAIEFKLFLLLPGLVFIWFKGYKKQCIMLASAMIAIGMFSYGYVLKKNRIAPGYMNLVDY